MYVPSKTSPWLGDPPSATFGRPRSYVNAHADPEPDAAATGVPSRDQATPLASRFVVTVYARAAIDGSVMVSSCGESPVTAGAAEKPGYGSVAAWSTYFAPSPTVQRTSVTTRL